MKKALDYITARAKERSTWLGLISLTAALGLALTPEQSEAIAAAGMAAAGIVTAFTKDKK